MLACDSSERFICIAARVACLLLTLGSTARAQSDMGGQQNGSNIPAGAKEKFESGVSSARGEYLESVMGEAKKYIEVLDREARRATKNGNLDEALSLKAEIQRVRALDLSNDLAALWGTWETRWNGASGSTRYSFRPTGAVVRTLNPSEGALKQNGADVLLEFDSNGVIRVNLSGGRLFLEFWRDRENYSSRYPDQVGIGMKVVE
ncbi:MAG: hypothetical protein KDA80_07585 [Planctomycetaceae bacterium]|nr:hypothetical protein [Planctomycetaceae bacterium]